MTDGRPKWEIAEEIRNRPRQPTEQEKAHAEARAGLAQAKYALTRRNLEEATAIAIVVLAIMAVEEGIGGYA